MVRVISDVKGERKITLELTETELATLVAAFGATTFAVSRGMSIAGVKTLKGDESDALYRDLRNLLTGDDAV